MAEAGPSADRSEDGFLDGGIRLLQPAAGYRAAIDPVFLAAAVDAAPGERVLHVGAGHGAASLCLARRAEGCLVTGLETQPRLAGLARENARANGLEPFVRVVEGDLAAPGPALREGGFDHVMANPPYRDGGEGAGPRDRERAIAYSGNGIPLEGWIGFMHRMARPKGTLTLIHRADRLDRILSALHGRCGGVAVFPLWPKAGAAARRVVVRARRGVARPAVMCPGLVLHEPDGAFTAAADAVLRGGALPVATG